MDETRDYSNGGSKITVFALAVLVLLTNVPSIQRGTIGTYLFIPFIGLLVLSISTGIIRIEYKNRLFVFCAIVYYAMAFIYKFTGISSAAYGRDMHSIMFFSFFIVMKRTLLFNEKQKRFILILIILTVFYTIIANVRLYNQLGNYRYLNLHRTETARGLGNLMSTQYSTALALLSGICFILFLKDIHKARRIIWIIISVIVIGFNTVISQRMTNLFLSIVMFLLIYFFRKQNKLYTTIIFMLGLAGLAALLFNFDTVSNYLSDIIGSRRISSRLEQISTYLATRNIQEAGGSLAGRYNLALRSINTWLSSLRTFFFGAGDHIDQNIIIGNHSEFIDTLARYGVIGASCFYYIVYRCLKEILYALPISRESAIYKQIVAIYIIFFVRGLIGGVAYEQIGICLFIFLPISISVIIQKEEME